MELKEFSTAVGTVLGYYKERVKNLKGITDIDNALKEIGRSKEVKRAKELIYIIRNKHRSRILFLLFYL